MGMGRKRDDEDDGESRAGSRRDKSRNPGPASPQPPKSGPFLLHDACPAVGARWPSWPSSSWPASPRPCAASRSRVPDPYFPAPAGSPWRRPSSTAALRAGLRRDAGDAAQFPGQVSGSRIHDSCRPSRPTSPQLPPHGSPAHELSCRSTATSSASWASRRRYSLRQGGPGQAAVQADTGGHEHPRCSCPAATLASGSSSRPLRHARADVGGGALDNTSGICTVLERPPTGRLRGRRRPAEASVVFAWYDGEEWGLFGSSLREDPPSRSPARLAPQTRWTSSSQSTTCRASLPAKNTGRLRRPWQTARRPFLKPAHRPIHATGRGRASSVRCYEESRVAPRFPAILANDTNYHFLVREVPTTS